MAAREIFLPFPRRRTRISSASRCSWRAKSSSYTAWRSAVSFNPRRSRYLRKMARSRVLMRLRLSLSCSILHHPRARQARPTDPRRPDAMWQGFTIALREGIESFLIVALTLSYLKRTGRGSLARAVWAGIAVSAVACVAAGILFSRAEEKPLWEGILAFAAAALVGSLLVYMKRVSTRMKSDMEHRIETRARAFSPRRAFWGVFAFTVLMIMREGLETALLVATAFFQLHSASVTMGL